MPSKKNFPEKIEEFDEHERSIPMKINYNKRSSFLQGSGDLVEEVNGILQMVKCVNAENQVERLIVDREGVG
jgi:signal recognition particle GTPase